MAAAFYEPRREGPGDLFLREVAAGFSRIARQPLSAPYYFDEFRRLLIPRFPYAIVYKVEDSRILIIAVAHLHRKPSYWKERL
jgi:plasmid stabilization system protein ParE